MASFHVWLWADPVAHLILLKSSMKLSNLFYVWTSLNLASSVHGIDTLVTLFKLLLQLVKLPRQGNIIGGDLE